MGYDTARIKDQSGFTLIEGLVASVIALAVLGALAMLMSLALKQDQRVRGRADTSQELGVAMERITQELRQASVVHPDSSTSTIDFDATMDGVAQRIRYSCSAGSCARYENGTLTDAKFVTGLASTDVFDYSPSLAAPKYVSVAMRLLPYEPSPGSRSAVNGLAAQTGISLRNAGGQL